MIEFKSIDFECIGILLSFASGIPIDSGRTIISVAEQTDDYIVFTMKRNFVVNTLRRMKEQGRIPEHIDLRQIKEIKLTATYTFSKKYLHIRFLNPIFEQITLDKESNKNIDKYLKWVEERCQQPIIIENLNSLLTKRDLPINNYTFAFASLNSALLGWRKDNISYIGYANRNLQDDKCIRITSRDDWQEPVNAYRKNCNIIQAKIICIRRNSYSKLKGWRPVLCGESIFNQLGIAS